MKNLFYLQGSFNAIHYDPFFYSLIHLANTFCVCVYDRPSHCGCSEEINSTGSLPWEIHSLLGELTIYQKENNKLLSYQVSRGISVRGEMERSKNNLIINAFKVQMWWATLSVM